VLISLENFLGLLLQLCQGKDRTLSRLKCLSGQVSAISRGTSGLRAMGYVCVYVCIYVCVYVYMHMYVYMYKFVLCMRVCTSECIYVLRIMVFLCIHLCVFVSWMDECVKD
jgi:hypothetical protein